MPVIRKATPDEVAGWNQEEQQAARLLAEALKRFAELPDRKGISRMRYARSEAGWFARIYTRSQTIGRLFSDAIYGGPDAALTVAITWRDATRAQFTRIRTIKHPQGRIVRVDQGKLRGYYAYPPDRKRRYFADGAHGGPEGSQRAAQNWIATPN